MIFSLILYNEHASEGKQTMQLKLIKAHEEKNGAMKTHFMYKGKRKNLAC